MKGRVSHSFDAVVINCKDLPEEYIKYVEQYFKQVPVFEYYDCKTYVPPNGKQNFKSVDDMSKHLQKRVEEEYKEVYQILVDVDMDSAFGSYINRPQAR